MSQLLKNTGIVGSLTILSRLLGFLRDHVIARVFGANLVTDIFFVAFRIPNLLRSLVAEGALTSAFVPVFSDESHISDQAAQDTFKATTTFLILATSFLSIAGILFTEELIAVIGAGFSTDLNSLYLASQLSSIMLPYIVGISIVALCNGALNVKGIYGSAPISQIIMNLCMTAGALASIWAQPENAIFVLAWSVLIGGFVQVVVQVPFLRRAGLKLRITLHPVTPSVLRILKLMLPAILGAAVYQVTIFIMTLFASLLPEGSVSYLQYADRIAQLPIGVFSIALASVLLPSLSKAASQKKWDEYSQQLSFALSITSLFMIPVSVGIYLYSQELTDLVFLSGKFGSVASLQTANAVRVTCFSLWATSCLSMLMRGFIARKDTLTPSLLGCLSLFCSGVLAILLMGAPEKGTDTIFAEIILSIRIYFSGFGISFDLNHLGLLWATAFSSFVSFIIGLIIFKIKSYHLMYGEIFINILQALGASCIMFLSCYYFGKFFSSGMLNLFSGFVIGSIVYLVSISLFGNQSVKKLILKLRK